jgi:hypothetical protein
MADNKKPGQPGTDETAAGPAGPGLLQNKPAEPSSGAGPEGGLTVRQRWWRYGSNTAILVGAVVVVVGLVDWLTARFNVRKDCTTGGIYSLAPRTHRLLRLVQRGGKTYYLVNLFPTGPQADPLEQARGARVRQLIQEYMWACPRVKAYQPRSHRALMQQLRRRIGNQFHGYRASLLKSAAQAAQIQAFLKTQATAITALAGQAAIKGNRSQEVNYAVLVDAFSQNMPQLLGQARRRLVRKMRATLPDWPSLVKLWREALDNVHANLVTAAAKGFRARFSPALQRWLAQRRTAMRKEAKIIGQYEAELKALKPVKSGGTLRRLRADCLLVMGPHRVKVIAASTLFVPRKSVSGRVRYLFEGEEAVDAALLSLMQKHRPKVVFVSIDPENLISAGGPLSHIARRLRRGNFRVYQWSPQSPNPQMPQAGPPPASGKGVIWVVVDLPASGPQAMYGLMPYGPLEQQINKHLAAGGDALFLVGAASPQMMMSMQGQIPFKSTLAGYGIRLRSLYTVVQRQQVEPGAYVAAPQFTVSSYPATVISKPIQSLRSIFVSYPVQNGAYLMAPTVLAPMSTPPKGVTAQVLVRSPDSPSVWATTQTQKATFDPSADLPAPVPVAAMAQKGASRVVAIGNPLFVANDLLESGQLSFSGGQPVVVASFPGNAELFMNSIYWLAHEANLIAAGPRATVAMRIARLSPSTDTLVRLISFIGPALLAVACGLMVFLKRRKV